MIDNGWGKRRRSALSLAAATAVLISLTPAVAGVAYAAETADPPAELVIPAEQTAAADAAVVRTGATGFLQGDGKSGSYRWFSYADGSDRTFAAQGATDVFTNGTDDTVARWYRATNKVVLQDAAGGAEETVQIPAGQEAIGLVGRTVVTGAASTGGGLHAVSLVNGAVRDVPVAGLQDGAYDFRFWGGNAHGFQTRYYVGNDEVSATAWVDLSGDAPKAVALDASARSSVVDGDTLLRVTDAGKLQVWDLKGDLTAAARETDWTGSDTPVRVQGDQVLSVTPGAGRTLLSRSFAGGEQKTVLDAVLGDPYLLGGDLLAVVKGDDAERVVHRVRAGADDTFAATEVAVVPGDRTMTKRISAAQGVLRTLDQLPSGEYRLRSIEMKAGGPLVAGDRFDRGTDAKLATSREVPTGDGRLVRQTGSALSVLADGASLPGTALPSGSVEGDLEASGHYASYRLTTGERRVLDLDTLTPVFTRNLGTGPTAIDGATLWTATGTAGAVAAIDVRTGATVRTVTAADCALKDVQSVGSDLYWKCDTKSGVLNTATQVNTPLPAHGSARLGDGFVSWAKGDVLSVTPLRGGGATREIGTVADVMPEAGWSVDRFGGNTVFTDDAGRIHVVPSGVPTSAVSVVDSTVPSDVINLSGGTAWTGQWWLSKPVASWTMTVKDRSGTVVRTQSGLQTRGMVRAVWDGNGPDRLPVADGGYSWELTAPSVDGSGAALRTTGTVYVTHDGISTFRPVAPARILNTLAGVGAPKAKVGQGGMVNLQVTGRGGVAARGVSAVVLNVTVTNPTSSTWVSVYPSGHARPLVSNLNVPKGRSVPNQVTVPVSRDGKVTLYNAWGSADLLVDVSGYYTLDGAGDRFKAVTPARILNTLAGAGAPKAKLGAGKTVNLQVTGRGGVPATGVTAVVMNVTATRPTAATYVSVYPYGTTRPATSNLNMVANQTVAGLVTVPVKNGKVTLYNHSGSVDLLGDVAGYFTNTAGQGDRFMPLWPVRLFDSRDWGPDAKIPGDHYGTLPVAGYGGIPESGATSLVLNVAGTNATAPTYLTVHPWLEGLPSRPTMSNLNPVPGVTVANQVVVKMSSQGSIDVYNRAGLIDVIVDAFGYYTK
ncbi:FlgD immunoglobulin-like domain containing protein [Streptomyces sp. NPDC004327]|uniref:FlgD immunoglobulin-like domain containing protein n=1 Tax=Streptomyces sp. NPDC004327 TaxID=3364699 RepID=UPI00369F2ECA